MVLSGVMTTLALFDSIEMDCNGLAFYLLSRYLNLLLDMGC